ncbi:MAG: hypothetical protein Q7R66_18325 [Undibacterium sp.]|nr:hypothetical protein [Undibacterium sp.]MDO8654132.1 hypothetical protein [Undibacterium sp.]
MFKLQASAAPLHWLERMRYDDAASIHLVWSRMEYACQGYPLCKFKNKKP